MVKRLEFEPYHVHSTYSNCQTQPDSTVFIEDYAKEYRRRGHHVLCQSEHGNRSNVYKQFEVAAKYSDDSFTMTPLAAAETYFVPDRNPELKDDRRFHLVLVAKNNEGLRQLNSVLSEANLSGFYRCARLDFDQLSRLDPNQFICTTACVGGIFKDDDGENYACQQAEIFKDHFFLEIQHHPQLIQQSTNQKILKMYQKHHWPLIYGTDSHYINHEDALLRKELLLSSGIDNGYEDDFDLYQPTAEEAFALLQKQNIFSKAQIEESFENTLLLREFEGVSFTTEKKIPNSRKNLKPEERTFQYKKQCCDGYIEKARMPSPQEASDQHAEMNAVAETGTADYFIAMKDIVDKGQEYGGILTTTGRGSGVSFATNFAQGFTSVNRLTCPVKLYPERFISRERLESGALPDLDLNMANVPAFEQAGKEILGEYGCQPMIAYGTAKTQAAFKLLARARNQDFQTSNIISKQIQNYELDVKHAKENNQDDPDYDVDEHILVESYVEPQYLQQIEDSKQYKGIVNSIVPHPCAHLLLDKDIREEIGIVRVKAKTGNKEAVYAAYIDGVAADTYGYQKADFLRVDVVKTIANSFEACGLPVMSVDELLEAVKDDKEVWNLYANGFTMGLNQCEKEKTTERVMQYKPKNVVELAAFVAAVRPGFKSMLSTFVSRTRFSYGIPSLDKLLQTKEIPDSFLMFDEQILTILQSAGISAADAYVCIKAIKKKKADKVASFRERFETGFTKMLKEEEGSSDAEAADIVDKIWTIINDAASYMFCAAHAYSMACDSLYAAWLKAHYPYELYTTMLKLYTEKGNKDKIAAIIAEMKKYKGIRMKPGQFGEDNRDWFVDKENQTISQSLSSIKFISPQAAQDLYDSSKYELPTFVDVLHHLLINTCLNTRQIEVQISIGYFSQYGGKKKLATVYQEFFKGKNKITKTQVSKTICKRMTELKAIESEVPNEDTSIGHQLMSENENIGLCLTSSENAPANLYFVVSVDTTYGVKVKLYSVKRGTSGNVKISKKRFFEDPFTENDCIIINNGISRQRTLFQNGNRIPIPGEYEYWVTDYHVAN